jgi:2-aminobenzoate-CoA ligase
LGGLLLFPLRFGASAVLVERWSPQSLLEGIAQHQASICFTAPTFYRQMAALIATHPVSSLRTCVSAGEALPDATRQLWRASTGIDLLDGMGATEMFHIFISSPPHSIKPGSIGQVVPGYEACVWDGQCQPLPPGQFGQLAVRGPTGCKYLSDERQHSYVRHGWNLTGDTVMMDAQGYVHYQARSDDMIISAGYNIGGPEVEDALLLHPAVLECGVIGKSDPERGMVVQAFCVLAPAFTPGPGLVKDLQDHVKQLLAPYKYPRDVVFVDQLPRTPTGKLQRFKLRDLHPE